MVADYICNLHRKFIFPALNRGINKQNSREEWSETNGH